MSLISHISGRLTAATFALLFVACSPQPARDAATRVDDGAMPADLSGYWERDYWRGDDVNRAIEQWFRRLRSPSAGFSPAGIGNLDNAGNIFSTRDIDSILALARLADEITRLRYFSISQTTNEISVERENDFNISCEFHEGVAQGAATPFGREICGWNGDQFITRLILPDDLLVSHRYTVAPNGGELHVATTVSSTNTGMAFTLGRFYTKYEESESLFNCIDTLSRNRVCTTEEGPVLLN